MTFDPTSIANCALWLNANNPTTLTPNILDTIGDGSIADGSAVAHWFDSSGNGNTATQAVGANQPHYHTVGSLGLPYLDFNNALTPGTGAGSYLTFADAFPSGIDNSGTGSYSFLFLVKDGAGGASYHIFATNKNGGAGKFFFTRIVGKWERFNAGSTVAMSTGAAHGLAYTFSESSANNGTETFYLDDASASGFARTGAVTAYSVFDPTLSLGADNTGGNCLANAELYEVVVYSRAISASEIAQIYSYWNGKYGTTFNTSVGPLTAGTVSLTSATQTTLDLSSSPAMGGTSPYTYQWYKNGVALSGKTTLPLSLSGLTPRSSGSYVIRVTDALLATADSAAFVAATHGTVPLRLGANGDSLTALNPGSGNPAAIFARLLQNAYPWLDVTMDNEALSGEYIRQLAHTNGGGGAIDTKVIAFLAAGVTIVIQMEGTNDAQAQNSGTATYTTAHFTQDLADVTSSLAAAGIITVLNQLIWRDPAGADTVVQAYNSVSLPAVINGTTVLQGDVAAHAYFAANQTELPDRLHPGSLGDEHLAAFWLAGFPVSLIPADPDAGLPFVAATAFDPITSPFF